MALAAALNPTKWKKDQKPRTPFNFNHACLGEEDFKFFISSNWKLIDASLGESAMYQLKAG
jgi:hypothetical protein